MRWFRRKPTGEPLDLSLEWEAGEVLDGGWSPIRVALVAHWSADGHLSRSVRTLAAELVAADFHVVVVSAAECEGRRPGADQLLPRGVTVLRRPNKGYDFGSWAAVLAAFPELAKAEDVVLANDSMVGPFGSLSGILERMTTSRADVWSMTESEQFTWHPQSYFVGYRNGVLTDPELASFWSGIRVHESKDDVIWNYELGQGQLIRQQGYSTAAAFAADSLRIPASENPTIKAWRGLLDLGLPLVKRQLITEPEVAQDAGDIPDELLRRFDVDVKEWL